MDAGPLPEMTPDAAAVLYRTAKEALANVAHHAEAAARLDHARGDQLARRAGRAAWRSPTTAWASPTRGPTSGTRATSACPSSATASSTSAGR